MERLKSIYRNRLKSIPMSFVRSVMNRIHWESRMIGIRGARGIGKTTLLLQRLKQMNASPEETLFVTLDNLYFSEHRLYDLADEFVKYGGRYLFIDEVHKYANWSQELKNIYDDFPQLSIAFTGSSLLRLKDGNADLSRRAVMYEMGGLSLREYAAIAHKIELPLSTLDDVLYHSDDISDSVISKVKPLQLFDNYLHYGYYPIIVEGKDVYYQRLNEVVNYIIEAELPQLRDVDKAMVPKIKQLLFIIGQSAPFTPNVAKLSEKIGISRQTLTAYINALHESRLTLSISRPNHGISALQKPDKLYIENTNLMYTLSGQQINMGNLRETFFANQIVNAGLVLNVSPVSDFFVNGVYTFEIGGQSKTAKQVATVENAYVVADGIEYGSANRLPLWQFGLLS